MEFTFYYRDREITKKQFESVVPYNWETDLDENNNYIFGYCKAISK